MLCVVVFIRCKYALLRVAKYYTVYIGSPSSSILFKHKEYKEYLAVFGTSPNHENYAFLELCELSVQTALRCNKIVHAIGSLGLLIDTVNNIITSDNCVIPLSKH